jgi:hypothetical protein
MTFCGKDKRYVDEPRQFDPLFPGSGGPEARSEIFDTFKGYLPEWLKTGDQSYQGAKDAAADPAWASIRNNAAQTGAGAYLGGNGTFNDIWNQYRGGANSQSGVTQKTIDGGYLNQTPKGLDENSWRPNSVTSRTLSGNYLYSSPQATANVDPMLAGIRNRAQSEAADAGANIRSQYGRAGMSFSTGNQQAEQAAKAAASSRSNETEAATRYAAQRAADDQKFQGYQAERGRQASAATAEDMAKRNRASQQAANYGIERSYQNQAGTSATDAARRAAEVEAASRTSNYGSERLMQNNAASQLAQAHSNPLQFLNSANSGNMATLQQIAQIVQGLSGGGQIATPNSTIVRQPGVYDYGLATLGAVGNL